MRKPYRTMREVDKFEARQFREVGMSVRDCATYFNVSVATVMRGLAEMRAKFGPEKLPRNRRHLARARVENCASGEENASIT
jgi:transposase